MSLHETDNGLEFADGLQAPPTTPCHKCGAPVSEEWMRIVGTDYCERCCAEYLELIHCPACDYTGRPDTETVFHGARPDSKGPAEPATMALKCPRCHDTRIEVEVWR